jgi:hypothetical protein
MIINLHLKCFQVVSNILIFYRLLHKSPKDQHHHDNFSVGFNNSTNLDQREN